MKFKIKKLKLFFGILIGVLTMFNCSNNDDSNSNQNEISLIGIWKPTREVYVCSTGSEEFSQYSTCHQQSRYTFSQNGTITITEYQLENNNCSISYQENGTWQLNNGLLTIVAGGETNTPTFYELTNTNLRIGYYEDNNTNEPCDGGNLPSHYYTEFIKAE